MTTRLATELESYGECAILLQLAYKRAKKAIFHSFFNDFFGRFSIDLAPSGAKYCGKRLAAIGKSFGKGLARVWLDFGKS